jgi:hypothetical protein
LPAYLGPAAFGGAFFPLWAEEMKELFERHAAVSSRHKKPARQARRSVSPRGTERRPEIGTAILVQQSPPIASKFEQDGSPAS